MVAVEDVHRDLSVPLDRVAYRGEQRILRIAQRSLPETAVVAGDVEVAGQAPVGRDVVVVDLGGEPARADVPPVEHGQPVPEVAQREHEVEDVVRDVDTGPAAL